MKKKIADLAQQVSWGSKIPGWLLNLGERFLGFHQLNVAHSHIEEDWDKGSKDNFFSLACKYIPLKYELSGLENIPKEGPCVIVCNHPHGMSDGLMFGDIAMKVRSDVRIVVNEWLRCVRGMQPYEITVDVYGGEAAKRANMAGMREILQWLRAGHCILVFPSGSAASYSHQDKRVVDDPWQTNIAGIIRKTGATVVPMHIAGRTGLLFQLFTILCKQHRAALLAREIKRDSRTLHTIRLGKPITPSAIARFETDTALSDFLRLSSMMLQYIPQHSSLRTNEELPREMKPIEPKEDEETLAQEMAALPAEALLYAHESSGLNVYCVTATQIPHMLHEIGVQREITFRAVGEGSGTSCDLDDYDYHYDHLVMWDPAKKKLAGAYRMGRTDLITREKGAKGIYNSLFFNLGSRFIEEMSQGVEMGRAFITAAYQRHPAALDTLWMGIGHFLNRYPQYRYLYGTVSISADYTKASRALMLSYLKSQCMLEELSPHISAKHPPLEMELRSEDARLLPTAVADVRALTALVNALEPDGKGIPVLLRQYLRLGGRMVSFGVDKNFGNTLDCMVIVDMQNANRRIVERYRGKY